MTLARAPPGGATFFARYNSTLVALDERGFTIGLPTNFSAPCTAAGQTVSCTTQAGVGAEHMWTLFMNNQPLLSVAYMWTSYAAPVITTRAIPGQPSPFVFDPRVLPQVMRIDVRTTRALVIYNFQM
jgi:hypothetical protein